ncbi:retrovirus-related Pol polyprotein from type-1 retrotransposable element R1 4 [Elysia marginata]|uniref:Retrovirus-related Pol polyprotein from type-1 retrotransposable element R1 4 n=1 Tax=Elysia marginata TaxID=1093978 RepID=A0AAV4FGX9_9GAST|nr:retrovirus-related Pol polyprotein from type-1 retrotransposable element R1 4 [Elysia marginata]
MGNRGIHWNCTGASTTDTGCPKNVDRKMADEKKNPEKTTFTTFTLSNKSQTVHLKIGEHQLREEPSPTYLGVTFDKRRTSKAQTDKCQERGILHTGLLRRLAGTQWGTDMTVLKTVYTGYVRTYLEYGSSAWNTTAKSNQKNVEKVQNQSLRKIIGGLKSTPILKMETIPGLQTLEESRETKILTQRQKYKAMPNCALKRRLKDTNKGRLKRNSFHGTARERSFACGRRCTKYKAETDATKQALKMVNNKISKTSKVVILSDARSVLQTLENSRDTELGTDDDIVSSEIME